MLILKDIKKEGICFINSRGPGNFDTYSIHQIEPIVVLMGSEVKRIMSVGSGKYESMVIEFSNDNYGPIWPRSIAPYQVQVCALDLNKPGVADAAEKLVADLEAAGIEVLYDDRGEKAGFVFSDADLIGIPLRIVVSPKTLAESQVEFKRRGERDAQRIALDAAVQTVADAVKAELAKYQI